MTKEKQIEEMKNIIDKAEEEYSELWNEWFYDHKESTKIDNEFLFFAKMLYDAGYRKASEVAEEIFAEIEREIKSSVEVIITIKDEEEDGWYDGELNMLGMLGRYIAELKKKYESEKDNGN